MNAAYLSALKCWLPIGKLEHHAGTDGVDPKRSGVHLITPAEWAHPHLLTLTSLPEAILIPMSLEMAPWPARCRR
ncbi:hypothetical protein ACM9HB_35560, partial [Streptomyces sp. JAC128]